MRGLVRTGLIATLLLLGLYGCEESGGPTPQDAPHDHDRRERSDQRLPNHEDEDFEDEESLPDGGGTQGSTPDTQVESRRTEVPDEIVGTWQHGSISLATWENYTQGYYAGRNAVPTREMMTLRKNGDATFYRYEFAFGVYEELIDCEGTVSFNGDGTFTFYPTHGRKRFLNARHREDNVDRPLTPAELAAPKLAGKRAYSYDGSAAPAVLRITVPSSAPYNWYKQE